jgi:hypothetical protein
MGGTPPYGYDLAYFNAAGEFLMIVRFMPDGSKQVLTEKGELQRTIGRGDQLLVSKQDRAHLVPSAPERVAALQEIFRLYVRDGLGFRNIAAHLNEKGLPSPRNGEWSRMHSEDWAMTSIRDILMNPAYAGDAVWNRRSFARFHRLSGKALDADLSRRPGRHLELPADRSHCVRSLRAPMAGVQDERREAAEGWLAVRQRVLRLRRLRDEGQLGLRAGHHPAGRDRGPGDRHDRRQQLTSGDGLSGRS